MIVQILTKEKSMLETHIKILRSQIAKLPEGELRLVENGNYVKWYQIINSKYIYLSKKERKLAEALALKKYYSLQLDEQLQKIHLLNQYLGEYTRTKEKLITLIDNSTYYHELLKPHFNNHSSFLENWLNEEYERNSHHMENLIYKTLSGQYVRSKSEVIIANTLYSNKIPFRYECGIRFDNILFFPDFTICHPQTMQIFYWEHFGIMDKQSYCDNAFSKLKIYGNQGIIPSINLITTYETQDHPIDSSNIELIVQQYFLS